MAGPERFEQQLTLTHESIAEFARLAGDGNPIHSDPELAARSRFGGIVASGTQVTSLMMGLSATHFAHEGGMLGLEFRFRFSRPVRPDVPLCMWWQVVGRSTKASLGGDLVLLVGKTEDDAGVTLVKGSGKVLVTPAG